MTILNKLILLIYNNTLKENKFQYQFKDFYWWKSCRVRRPNYHEKIPYYDKPYIAMKKFSYNVRKGKK